MMKMAEIYEVLRECRRMLDHCADELKSVTDGYDEIIRFYDLDETQEDEMKWRRDSFKFACDAASEGADEMKQLMKYFGLPDWQDEVFYKKEA